MAASVWVGGKTGRTAGGRGEMAKWRTASSSTASSSQAERQAGRGAGGGRTEDVVDGWREDEDGGE